MRKSIKTKASMVELSVQDSLRLVNEMQTSKEALMQNMVVKQNGVWRIAISKDQALTLGVPETVYENYVEYVRKLNQ